MLALHIDHLTVSYGSTPAIEGVCLDLEEGSYLGVIGPNGSGKTTFLKTILGLIEPDSGRVEVFGKNPAKDHVPLAYVPQFAALDKAFPITMLEVVLTGCLAKGFKPFFRYQAKERDLAMAYLDQVGIGHLANRQIAQLSGGEFQRMLIARALAVKPKLLLLDEPTASVDAASREQIFNLLGVLNKDMTIILVTHDLMAISSHVKSLACLNTHLVYHGEPEINEAIVNQLYGCPIDLLAHGVPHRVLKEHGRDQ